MLRKLYKIWRVVNGVQGPPYCDWVEYSQEKGTWAYPLVQILSTLADHWHREDVVSADPSKLEDACSYWNRIADEDVHYEIREEEVDDLL